MLSFLPVLWDPGHGSGCAALLTALGFHFTSHSLPAEHSLLGGVLNSGTAQSPYGAYSWDE